MKKSFKVSIWLLAALLCTACAERVSFSVGTLPAIDGLQTEYTATRDGNEWHIDVCARNNSSTEQTFKLFLAAEPHLRADSYMFPGTNYNGNLFGDNVAVPQGWEHDGEPWVFAYDRGSIPSCTISENEDKVFALFVSDCTPESYQSSCSMELLDDGSFRHLIYWPVTEAPLVYSDKLKFSDRYETYLTLAPGEEFHASAIACIGKPRWPNFGFAEVFPVAWRHINHEVPSQRTFEEVMRLDKAFQDWGRRQDENGYWYDVRLDDQTFRAGYFAKKNNGLSPDGYTIEDYTKHPELNRWYNDDLEQSKRLKKGEYVKGSGGEIGFGCQVFQAARLSMEYGYRNNVPEDIDYGLKVFRSWLEKRIYPSGILKGNRVSRSNRRNASNMGWSISELSRVAMLLEANGEDASELKLAAKRIVDVVRAGVREDGALGSIWYGITGEVVNYNGDSGGFVLMGLVRYWLMSGDDSLLPIIERAFEYYYTQDINHFRCFGGAMDCASIDKEGIQPFFTSAKLMYEATGEEKYLEYARKAAWYFASWIYIQNPIYDADDDLTIYNWRPAGANIVGVEHPALDEYGSLLIGEYIWLSKVDNEPLWREIAELMWRNSTQGFADEKHRIWHNMERPIGAKNEAIFPSRWSKYRYGESKRGSINDHLTGWAGIYRTASVLDMEAEDVEWLKNATRPE